MPGVNVFAADTGRRSPPALVLARQGHPRPPPRPPAPLAAPEEGFDEALTPEDRLIIDSMLGCSAVARRDSEGVAEEVIERTSADELMISCQVFDHAARLRSYEIAAQIQR